MKTAIICALAGICVLSSWAVTRPAGREEIEKTLAQARQEIKTGTEISGDIILAGLEIEKRATEPAVAKKIVAKIAATTNTPIARVETLRDLYGFSDLAIAWAIQETTGSPLADILGSRPNKTWQEIVGTSCASYCADLPKKIWELAPPKRRTGKP